MGEERSKSLCSASIVVDNLSGVVELRYRNQPVLALEEAQNCEVSEGDIEEKYGVFFKNVTSAQTIYFLIKIFQHR